MLLRRGGATTMTSDGPSLPWVGQWQMPGKHCSPHKPPLAVWRGAGQPRLRVAGPRNVSCFLSSGCWRLWPARSEEAQGSRLSAWASAVCLYLTPCSISKQAWVLCVCLSSDRRQLPRARRRLPPGGPPPCSHPQPNAAWQEQADD